MQVLGLQKHPTESIVNNHRLRQAKKAFSNQQLLHHQIQGSLKIPKFLCQIMSIIKERNRSHSWCCGAGGGVKSQYPDLAKEISKERIKEAIDSGAVLLTTSCPFCIGNLKDAYDDMSQELKEKIIVVDIIDLIASKI